MERIYTERNTHKKTFTILALCFIFTAYFIYHMVVGKYGLVSYFQSIEQLEEKKETLKDLKKEIKQQETKIKGLKSKTLDLDLLDEQARKTLGQATENEIVVYDDKVDAPKAK